jgi:hypothetical protein
MITDLSTGQPFAVINPNYSDLAALRGNHPNIQYQYLCLRRIGKVAAFLQYFPQYISEFTKFIFWLSTLM